MRTAKTLAIALVSLLALGACGSEDDATGEGGQTDIGNEGGPDVPDTNISPPDTSPGDADVGQSDVPDSTPDTDTQGGLLSPEFGNPCKTNADCIDTGWCVPSPAGNVCTQTCIDWCPNGWSCELITNSVGDPVFICVNSHSNLCRPCLADSDCRTAGVDKAFCINSGDDGSFCGSPCDKVDNCPKGTVCETITLLNGVTAQQCVPEEGASCTCNAKAVSESAYTTCVANNEFGACDGARVCSESGLTPCGPAPAQEICNKNDDDCNGVIDDVAPFACQNNNEFGTCTGQATCQNGLLICDAPAPGVEICDGIDNNCDGNVDENASCDDSNLCTTDACVAGVGCVNTSVTCDDGNACTDDTCDPFTGCKHTPKSCDDGNACTDDTCNPSFGCVFTVKQCNDGNVCNGVETCNPSTGCVSGQAPNCNDSNVCTNDICHPQLGCVNEPLDCDDGNSCTANQCNPATGCVHPPLVCNDNDPCTTDSCEPGLGCSYKQIACNDNNACTTDACVPGQGCVNTPISCDDGNACTTSVCLPASGCSTSPVNCSDGNACNGIETCNSASGCLPGTTPNCDDGKVCTVDSCDPAIGCVNQALACDDGDACTVNSCNDAGGCEFTPLNCNDGNVCNGVETCNPATGCVGGMALNCNDSNVCTADSCDPNLGCVNTQISCSDGNACTNDTCNAVTGCQNTNIQCSDGNVCNGTETCNPASGCVPGTPIACDDGNACTVDSCDPVTGCKTAPLACNDGNACTEDFCDPASGCKTTPLVCSDGNLCTQDSCNPATGCVFSAVACNDNNPCNGVETCSPATGCVAGTPLNCDDGNPCTSNSCNPATGCASISISGPCNDGNSCTTNDMCSASVCSGTPVTCPSDGDPCTLDVCSPASGQCYGPAQDGTTCDDGENCTTPDTCQGGFCQGLALPECTDPNAKLVCVLQGPAGTIIDCPLMLANAQPGSSPPATALQLTMKYDAVRARLDYFVDGLFCPIPGNCIGPYTLPEPFTSLQSGHLIEINPKPLSTWNASGVGEFLLVHLSDPSTPLTAATVVDGMVTGDSVIMAASFTLQQAVPANNPVFVTIDGISVADPQAQSLDFEVIDLVIRTQKKN